MPFFSVVIPVYNRAKLITATINSVLEQEFEDYELIIVNDGSTDNTEEVIQNYLTKSSKIIYIWQANAERGAARNKGIRTASGSYVVFLDSDDLMQPEYLTIIHKRIVEQDFPNFIATKYLLNKNGKHSSPRLLKLLNEGYYDINLQMRGAVLGSNVVVKKNNPKLNLFVEDRKYAVIEDWMFIMQNLEHDRIYLIDKYMIIMNDHDDRSMRGSNIDILSKRLAATIWIEENIALTAPQKKKLWGHSFHFCAIHSYVDGRRRSTFLYLFKSFRLIGIDKTKLLLLMKNIIGYKMIQNFK